MVYNQYSHFWLDKTIYDFKSISYRTVEYLDRSDSLFRINITYDSIYLLSTDTTQYLRYESELTIHIDDKNLENSNAQYPNSEPWEVYKLSMIKKHRINDKEYLIYRFNTSFHGTTYPGAIFFAKEFGIIARFAYERRPLDLLVDIEGLDNKDYLKISKELINDSTFLFSLNYEL